MSEPTAIQKWQTAILTAAAEAVVKEATPEQMAGVVKSVLENALVELTTHSWGLQKMVRDAAEAVMTQYLKTPAVMREIREAAESGVNEALKELPAATRGKVVDLALKGIADAFAREKRGY